MVKHLDRDDVVVSGTVAPPSTSDEAESTLSTSEHHPLSLSPLPIEPNPPPTRRRPFRPGVGNDKKPARVPQSDPLDYEQKYPRDVFGQERAENARVWLTYLDEAESYDRDKVDSWNDTINILLVFIGIFSAIVSTFVSQSSTNMQPNSSPKSESNAKLVNALWFSSLTISLCTALIAALTKQWLYYFVTPVSGTAREKVRVRQFRFEGLEKWKVALIIDFLPVLLHLALGLFLIGLVAFVKPLIPSTAYVITILSGFTYTLYLVTTILPIWYPQCPYATPLTNYIGFFVQLFRFNFRSTGIFSGQNGISSHHNNLSMRSSLYREHVLSKLPIRQFQHSFYLLRKALSKTGHQIWSFIKSKLSGATLDQAIRDSIPKNFRTWRESQLTKSIETEAYLDDKAVHWLSSTSSNPSVTRIIARSAFISPGFRRETGLRFRLSENVFRDPRYDDEWNEESLRDAILNDAEFFEDLCYGLYMDFIFSKHSCEYTPLVLFIWNKQAAVREAIQANYPELFNLITTAWDVDCAKSLIRGFRDREFKHRKVVWLHLLEGANDDKELALQILTSDSDIFNKLFTWSVQPSYHVRQQHTIFISLDEVEELNELIFFNLFHFFLKYHCSTGDSGSFESRYLLFITIYQNLVSGDPLIVNPVIRERALIQLFAAFSDLIQSNHECIGSQTVTAEFLDRFHRDLLLPDSFFSEIMSFEIQENAVACFETFWEYRMKTTGDFSRFFSTQKDQLQFIYRWCSKGRLSRVTMIQQLFMPVNLPNLSALMFEDDRNSLRANFKNCLSHLLWSVENLESKPYKYWTLHDKYVIPNILHMFKSISPSDPVYFAVLYHPSVLVEAWQLMVTYPLDLETNSEIRYSRDQISHRARAFFATLQSKLDLQALTKVYNLMIQSLDRYRFKVKLMEILCRSAYILGRRIGRIRDPAEFDLPNELVQILRKFLNVQDVQDHFEREFIREKARHSQRLLLKDGWLGPGTMI